VVDLETDPHAEIALKCPYAELLKVLGRPYTLAILYSFKVDSALRFTTLQKELGLQPKTLTARLHELVEFGLLTRKSYNEIPPRVEYATTKKGKDLRQMFDGMDFWAAKYSSSTALLGRPIRNPKAETD